jgi:hypothetical protein
VAFIPIDPETGEIPPGSIRGMTHAHGTIADLYSTPSEIWPVNMTSFLNESEVSDIFFYMTHFLIPGVFGSSGAVAITPDFLGYGESYQANRTYGVKQNYAQAMVLVRDR